MTNLSTDPRRLAAGVMMPGFVGLEVPAWLRTAVDAGLASVCLYGTNIESTAQLAELTTSLRALGPNLVVSTDEEAGDVTRLHYLTGSPQPGAAALGRVDDLALTRDCAAATAAELAAYGINLNLAPVADVNANPANPVIGTRSFGATPDLVGRHVVAWVEAQQASSVAACVKHFPGHGDTSVDSHVGLPTVTASVEEIERRDLPPFLAAVRAGAGAVMTSHIVVPALDPEVPATFSAPILQGVLRDALGFEGVVVTDALDMAGASATTGIPEAAVRALVAGCDLLCLGSETTEAAYAAVLDAVVAAVGEGRVTVERLSEAGERVRRLATAYAMGDGAAAVTGGPDPARFAEAVELGPRVEAWLAGDGDWVLVTASTETNLAVGGVPWGLGALASAVEAAQVRPGERVVVTGRGIGADHPAVALASRLADAGHCCLLVEHGWPRPGVVADVVTHGGSPALAKILLDRLRPDRRRGR